MKFSLSGFLFFVFVIALGMGMFRFLWDIHRERHIQDELRMLGATDEQSGQKVYLEVGDRVKWHGLYGVVVRIPEFDGKKDRFACDVDFQGRGIMHCCPGYLTRTFDVEKEISK